MSQLPASPPVQLPGPWLPPYEGGFTTCVCVFEYDLRLKTPVCVVATPPPDHVTTRSFCMRMPKFVVCKWSHDAVTSSLHAWLDGIIIMIDEVAREWHPDRLSWRHGADSAHRCVSLTSQKGRGAQVWCVLCLSVV